MTRGSPAERTAEEREQARLERARRRAEREGLPPPASAEPQDPFDAVAAEANGQAAEPEPLAAQPEPPAPEPEPEAEAEPAPEEPPPPEPEVAPPPEPVAAMQQLPEAGEQPPEAAVPEPEPEPVPLDGPSTEELPAGGGVPVAEELPAVDELPAAEEQPAVDELPAPDELPAAEAPPPPEAPAQNRRPTVIPGERLPPLPAAARSPLTPRERSHRTRIAAVVALGLVIAAAVVLLVRGSPGGKSTRTAAAPPVVHVLIPEGQTRLQIAQRAARAGLTGSYRVASKRSPLLDPRRYGAPASTADLEGFLFPATYDMYPRAPVGRLVEEQLVAFKENFGAQQIARAKALHITPYELLIVASMVEREAQVPGDRAKIAGVIYNRLKRGMPLGVDATLYYAIEIRENIPTYTKELTESQLHMASRYNTRTHAGLPPTPISNPGAASIEAAGSPAHVPYLYYVLAPDGCGEHVFSTTEAQFQANAAAYQAALRAGGGHLPACKKK